MISDETYSYPFLPLALHVLYTLVQYLVLLFGLQCEREADIPLIVHVSFSYQILSKIVDSKTKFKMNFSKTYYRVLQNLCNAA